MKPQYTRSFRIIALVTSISHQNKSNNFTCEINPVIYSSDLSEQ